LTGTRSNRAALGARVRVDWHGMTQVQDVLAASGFCAQSQRRLHFGLGADPGPVRVTIYWPAGTEQVLDAPAVNQVNRIIEPAPAGQTGGQP
jgi:enediyne biosynthesis protein E4